MPISHYYADGERIELAPDSNLRAVVVDEQPGGGGLQSIGRSPAGRLRLVTRNELRDAGKADRSEYPVFRSRGAIMVALPEVYVEEGRRQPRAEFDEWLRERVDDVKVTERDEYGVTLAPASGSGEDALRIANYLVEALGLRSVTPRFIRLTPRLAPENMAARSI